MSRHTYDEMAKANPGKVGRANEFADYHSYRASVTQIGPDVFMWSVTGVGAGATKRLSDAWAQACDCIDRAEGL